MRPKTQSISSIRALRNGRVIGGVLSHIDEFPSKTRFRPRSFVGDDRFEFMSKFLTPIFNCALVTHVRMKIIRGGISVFAILMATRPRCPESKGICPYGG